MKRVFPEPAHHYWPDALLALVAASLLAYAWVLS